MVCFCLLLLLQPRPSQSRIGSSSLVTSSLVCKTTLLVSAAWDKVVGEGG